MSTPPHWPSADDAPLALRQGQVDCWAVPVTGLPETVKEILPELLCADEQARAARFQFERDRARYLARHAALRFILGRTLGVEPASLVFAEETNGRPVLAHPAAGLHFNLSRSGDLALLAVAASAVGVDLEQMRAIPDFLQVARHHFAAAEIAHLIGLAPEKQLSAFYTIWTRKEAFVKAIGDGLSYPLAAFSTGRTDLAPLLQIGEARPDNWTMADLAPGAGYAGALAIRQSDISIRCFTADWEWLLAPSSGLR
jgi:4'-phosphopantetheinyl transferase